jgi:hypothetical protein
LTQIPSTTVFVALHTIDVNSAPPPINNLITLLEHGFDQSLSSIRESSIVVVMVSTKLNLPEHIATKIVRRASWNSCGTSYRYYCSELSEPRVVPRVRKAGARTWNQLEQMAGRSFARAQQVVHNDHQIMTTHNQLSQGILVAGFVILNLFTSRTLNSLAIIDQRSTALQTICYPLPVQQAEGSEALHTGTTC